MATVTIMDPVTRIEGHMKVELTIDKINGENRITDARCTGTLFRGFEVLLQNRDPWDAPIITSRICGVCPVSHSMAAVKAMDSAAGVVPPADARWLRNLVLGANFIQSHILHFYLLAALDYVKFLEQAPWSPAWEVDFRSGKRTEAIGANYSGALEARRRAHAMGAIFGGKMPTTHAYIPGGFTAVPTGSRIREFREHLDWLTDFIRRVYIVDAENLADAYADYFGVGVGYCNLLAYGVFDENDSGSRKLLAGGFVRSRRPQRVLGVRTELITESVTHSWYNNVHDNLHPFEGVTDAVDPLEKDAAYSWLKAPRYQDGVFEVGPLARMWVNGDYRNGVSVMDRHLARAYEALKVAEAMKDWLGQLTPGAKVYNTYRTPTNTTGGIGLTEAPRGALGHWVEISGGKIANYQVITPTCWNASPRDGKGRMGAMEKALKGTMVEQPDKPIEALRIIHSFDPCLSCAVHIMRPEGTPLVIHAGGR